MFTLQSCKRRQRIYGQGDDNKVFIKRVERMYNGTPFEERVKECRKVLKVETFGSISIYTLDSDCNY